MKVIKTFKYRLCPTEAQQHKLAVYFGNVRFVYNYFLSERKMQYERYGKSDNYYAQAKKLTALKKEEAYSFLNDTACLSLQFALKNLENAYTRFFTKKSGFPKFHRKKARQSFSSNHNMHFKGDRICFIGFKEGLKCRLHRPIKGTMKELSVVKYPSGKYYVNIVCEYEEEEHRNAHKEIGIDLGVKNLVITSDGRKFDNPKFLVKYQEKLAIAQRHLSRKKKGSNGYESQRVKVARLYEKIADCRSDMLHKLTFELTTTCSDLFLEGLNVKEMQQDRRLSKSIADCSWGRLIEMFTYKGRWYGCKTHKISRWYPSSKTCSNCNYTLESLPLDVREWDCPNCGSHLDRDVNAAINILKEGKRELSAGTVDYTDGESVRIRRSKKSLDHDSVKSEAPVPLDLE